MSRLLLAGRVVLVTGAARGIGAELARQAAARGARLSLVGLEPDGLAALAATLGPGHVFFEADVSDQVALDRAVRGTVEALGGIDVVVANAGIAPYGTVAMTPVDVLARTVEVNLLGAIRTVAATLPHVLARRGHVLVVSSAAAFTVLPSMAAYCASKAGVEHFATALRLEVAHAGVSVGSGHPGWIDTDLVSDLEKDLSGFRPGLRRLPGPLGTVTSVEDCARALVDGIESRRARVYVPRSLAWVQALRPLLLGPLGTRVLERALRRSLPALEGEVRALGRFFGRRSVESASHAIPQRQSGPGS